MSNTNQAGKVYEGNLTAQGLRIAIVCSRFNELFTKNLLEGAVDAIRRHGGDPAAIEIAWVPGSYEVPLIAQKFAQSGRFDAVIALGMVIRGGTTHAEHINSYVANSLGAISRETGVPVIYGVVTCEDLEQAMERSGTKHGNRGYSAALCAIEMANLIRAMNSST